MNNITIKTMHKNDQHPMLRELSKSSNILENRNISGNVNGLQIPSAHLPGNICVSSYCSKSDLETNCHLTHNSNVTPENTHRYSEQVMASTNFTVSENNTKDSSIGSDILDRVITDLLANFDEKFELEKGIWDIDDYIMKLKGEMNIFHNNFNWNNSNGSSNYQHSNSRSDYSELQRKIKMNEAIRMKMAGTLKTNTNERESITNLFKYVVRDQKKEFNNVKNQTKQHLSDKTDLKSHIGKLESEINNKNNEVSLLFKQLEEKDKLFKQLESNNATISYYQQIIQKFVQMDNLNNVNNTQTTNPQSCERCCQDNTPQTQKMYKNFKFPDKKQIANYYNKSNCFTRDQKRTYNNEVERNNNSSLHHNHQKGMVSNYVSNNFSNTNSRNVLKRKNSMFTYITDKNSHSENSCTDMQKSQRIINNVSENTNQQNFLNFDTNFSHERVSSRILKNEANMTNQQKKEIIMNNIKKNKASENLETKKNNLKKQLSYQNNIKQNDFKSKTLFVNKENHKDFNNNKNSKANYHLTDAAIYEKNAERMHNNLLQNNYLSNRSNKNCFINKTMNNSVVPSQKHR